MQSTLVINDRIAIPRSELQFSYARSSGPGGQNVNKVNTKAIVHWDVINSPSLNEEVRQRLLQQQRNRINDRGQLVLSSDRWREQGRNVAECLSRLQTLVQAAARKPTIRKPTKPSRRANEKRLQEKRKLSQKKSLRRQRDDD